MKSCVCLGSMKSCCFQKEKFFLIMRQKDPLFNSKERIFVLLCQRYHGKGTNVRSCSTLAFYDIFRYNKYVHKVIPNTIKRGDCCNES